VSPLWRDEIGIFVTPGSVHLNRMCRGLRPRCVADVGINVRPRPVAGWAPALEALGVRLAEPAWQDANARVVVSDLWVRYAIVPWTGALSGHQERLVHARYLLSQSFGEMGDDWDVALSEAGPGRPQVACAMPRALSAGLTELLVPARLRLLSLQPQLVVAFNCWRHVLPRSGAWLVSLATGSLAAAHLGAEGWDQVRSIRIGSDWATELRRLRTFGRLAAGGSSQSRVLVDAPYWLQRLSSEPDDGLEFLDQQLNAPLGTLEKLVALKGMHA
jgi:hypothetical protein